jgi:hypothetical protein
MPHPARKLTINRDAPSCAYTDERYMAQAHQVACPLDDVFEMTCFSCAVCGPRNGVGFDAPPDVPAARRYDKVGDPVVRVGRMPGNFPFVRHLL